MTEIPHPTTVRCEVAFSRVIYHGACQVEGVSARYAATLEQIESILEADEKFHISIKYGQGVYSKETIEEFGNNFCNLLPA
jgi:hypothetical protein